MRSCAATLAIVCLIGGSASASADDETMVALMRGVCRKLTTPTADLSSTCRSVVVTTTNTRGGRVGFDFVSGSVAVTFSGSAREIRVSDVAGVQVIDKVITVSTGTTKTIVAVGSCRYTNALTPKPMVNCKAETEEGNFLASFDVVKTSALDADRK